MADKTGIEWTDATVNFWWGCTKVGPGCDHCYAETLSGRFGENLWGVGAARRKIKGAAALLNRLDNDYAWWAADAQIGGYHPNSRRRVFIQSMSDLFDNEVPLEWFAEAWGKIVQCDRIDIQIVTKRISVVEKRLAAIGVTTWPKHAGLLVTVCNQDEADRDIPRLLALKVKLSIPWVGVSAEPLLAPIDFEPWLEWQDLGAEIDGRSWGCQSCDDGCRSCPERKAHYHVTEGPKDSEGCPEWVRADRITLDWIIAGGESGPKARPMHPEWARSIRDQCAAAGTAFFFKQWGEWCPISHMDEAQSDRCYYPAPATRPGATRRERKQNCVLHADGRRFDGRDRFSFGAFMAGTGAMTMFSIGKASAGRLLDGVEHNAMPEVLHG
ncbi:hypothetical protein ASE63_07970 [Bosea sp. Root381]|uniref:DUF5131 family protein n=1 Tax=Bosea sp. Root381 TaxID=1736524 RepID=UPI0006F84933|nr:DUF5131 family protein [Bosea sp. Root381]KRE02286.1 hypothetical protein ASE63_07970 [Bosea sp. Root381]